MTDLKPQARTAFIVDELPGAYSFDDHWVMPDCSALRTLASILGEGSQAFLFLDWAIGDPRDSSHNYEWHEQFDAALRTAWQGETPPHIFVECGFTFKIHGGEIDDAPTSEQISGLQTGTSPGLGCPTTPTPIRIYSGDFWNEPADGNYTRALCEAIIAELNNKALQVNPSAQRFDARMNVWLERASAVSDVYNRVVHINGWKDGVPVIDSTRELPRPKVSV